MSGVGGPGSGEPATFNLQSSTSNLQSLTCTPFLTTKHTKRTKRDLGGAASVPTWFLAGSESRAAILSPRLVKPEA